jgi:hypothetical protein
MLGRHGGPQGWVMSGDDPAMAIGFAFGAVHAMPGHGPAIVMS